MNTINRRCNGATDRSSEGGGLGIGGIFPYDTRLRCTYVSGALLDGSLFQGTPEIGLFSGEVWLEAPLHPLVSNAHTAELDLARDCKP